MDKKTVIIAAKPDPSLSREALGTLGETSSDPQEEENVQEARPLRSWWLRRWQQLEMCVFPLFVSEGDLMMRTNAHAERTRRARHKAV